MSRWGTQNAVNDIVRRRLDALQDEGEAFADEVGRDVGELRECVRLLSANDLSIAKTRPAGTTAVPSRPVLEAVSVLVERVEALEARPEVVNYLLSLDLATAPPEPEARDTATSLEPLAPSKIEAAINERRPIAFVYEKAADVVPELRTLSPYEVYECGNRHYCVLGYDHDRRELRQFRLDRILRFELETPAVIYRAPQDG